MHVYEFSDLSVTIDKTGDNRYQKVSYPIRYGTYHEIRYGSYVFQFNLNGEIKHILCRGDCPMEPTEWLKRTVGNDWVYYASGGYNGAFGAVGEYYVPCFRYTSNGIMGGEPFKHGILEQAEHAFSQARCVLENLGPHPDSRFENFRQNVLVATPSILKSKASRLHDLLDGRISVLPPDARHADYDVIPLNISRGCLYNCRFCTVKTGRGFSLLSKDDIEHQIKGLKKIYDKDIVNYNSLFLGQHDALNAGEDHITWAASRAFDAFGFGSAHITEPRLFLFGSVGSLLQAPDRLFRALDRLPYTTYINIGLESADEKTLTAIGKPITTEGIADAFSRMEAINRSCRNIEITANFLYGESLPETHMPSCLDLIRKQYEKPFSRGAVYFSPYGKDSDKKSRVTGFKIIKNQCRLPVYLYIIQRL
ncbi:MAG: radical SAM protein [Desulfobacteraceae bacterium]|jgi:hypothetical protein